MLEPPNIDACTHDAMFAPDPWGTNTHFFCSVDIGTYLFLDVLAAHFWFDEGGPWLFEERGKVDSPVRRVLKQDARYRLRCNASHPNYIARQDRLRKAADAWNQLVASGDAGVK